ncbi:MAG: 3-hydroxyacyl-CoA dehydrogenase [Rhodobacteraceae bacterium HLUCCA12]|nr:MAG: 3-hydroxyacyl-CoA dehydrogenase [Rhodobacteraceae bacterium HLUCCA12]
MREETGAPAAPSQGNPATLRGAGAADDYVQRRTQDGIAILTLAGPGGNRFSPDLVHALDRALTTALDDPGVRALVLTARGPDFCAGPYADLPPPGPDPAAAPGVMASLDRLCHKIADSPRPVVCALHGRVTSAGLALALAARMRLGDPRAVLQFPETRLARLPPGNGAVRLAWRLGAEAALGFLAREGPLPATAAAGLIDRIEPEALVPAAIAQARALAVTPATDPAPGLADPAAYRAAIAAARAALPATLPPHRRHESLRIDSVESAQLLPPGQALELDSVLAEDCATDPTARALAHLARAARRVLDTPEARTADSAAAAPAETGPIAAALDGAEAALLVPPLLRSGARVVLVLPDTARLSAALETVAEAQLAAVADGRLTQAQADADWDRVSGARDLGSETGVRAALCSAALAPGLEAEIDGDAPLLVWNAALPPLAQPQRALSLVPAPVRGAGGMPRLVEIAVHDLATAATVNQASDLLLSLHLTPLRAAGAALLPLMLHAARQAAERLVALGVPAAALRDCGILPGAALLPRDLPSDPAAPAPALPLDPDRMILLALVNAGARLLQEGRALRPSDLDIAAVLGAGYPNWRGGPMAEADMLGPLVLRRMMDQAAPLDPDLWAPAPLIAELIRQGWRFEDLNTD